MRTANSDYEGAIRYTIRLIVRGMRWQGARRSTGRPRGTARRVGAGQPSKYDGGRAQGAAGRAVARARVLPAQQGHGDERQPGSSRRRARAATVRTAWESRERER